MRCPNCGYEVSKPHRYFYNTDGPIRHYVCWRCHYSWQTVEVRRASAERQAFQAAMWRITAGGKVPRAGQNNGDTPGPPGDVLASLENIDSDGAELPADDLELLEEVSNVHRDIW